jgi:hypothetical protein
LFDDLHFSRGNVITANLPPCEAIKFDVLDDSKETDAQHKVGSKYIFIDFLYTQLIKVYQREMSVFHAQGNASHDLQSNMPPNRDLYGWDHQQ